MKYLSKLKCFFVLAFLTLFVSATSLDVDAATKLKVHFVDVGQGDATVIQYGNSYSLIDTGTESNYPKLKSYLDKIGVSKISSLVLTHPDADHIGGADLLIRDYNVKTVYMTSKTSTTMEYKEVLNAVDDYNVSSLKRVKTGDKIPFGKLKGNVLSADSQASDTNDSSIVLLLKNKKNSFLFTGDASAKLENKLANEYNVDADVLKVSHHGSAYSSAAYFLKKVSPKYSVISVGKDNNYGHPDKYALKRIKKFSTKKIYRTDEDGTIMLTSNGKRLVVTLPGKSKDTSNKTTYKYAKSNGSTSVSKNAGSSTGSSTITSNQVTSSTVYITNSGTKYHEAGCRYLTSSKISISLTDAKNRGYTPCSVCH